MAPAALAWAAQSSAVSAPLASLASALAALLLAVVSAPLGVLGNNNGGYCNEASDYQPSQTVVEKRCEYTGVRGEDEPEVAVFTSECGSAGGNYSIAISTGARLCNFPGTLSNQDHDALCRSFATAEVHQLTCAAILGSMIGAADCVSAAATFNLSTTCCQGSGFTCITASPSPGPSPSPTTAYPSEVPSSSAPTLSAAPTTARPDASPGADRASDTNKQSSLTTPLVIVCVISAILLALVTVFKYQMRAKALALQRNRSTALAGAEPLPGGDTKPGRSLSSHVRSKMRSKKAESTRADTFGADVAAMVRGSVSEGAAAHPSLAGRSFSAYGLVDEFAGDRPPSTMTSMAQRGHSGSPDFDPFAELGVPSHLELLAGSQPGPQSSVVPALITLPPVTPLGGLVFTAPPRVGEHKLPTNSVLRSISGLSLTGSVDTEDSVYLFHDGEPDELKLEDCLEAASSPPTRRGSTFSFGPDGSSGLSGITESAV